MGKGEDLEKHLKPNTKMPNTKVIGKGTNMCGWWGGLGWTMTFRQSISGFVGKTRGASEAFQAGEKNNQDGALGR